MASIIKVDTIQDQDGNNIISEAANTITIGASGDTITIPSGATLANSGIVTGFQSTGIDDNATSTAITIDSSERVGIGTSSPDENLHIQTSTNTPGTIKLERGTSNVGTGEAVGELKFATADISYTGYTSTDEVAKISAVSPNSFGDRYDLAFYTGISTESTPGERLRITNNGRVGINTSSPSQDLSISNSGNTALELLSGTSSTGQLLFSDSGYGGIGNIQYSHSDNSMRFGINTSERMRIDSSGNVGIGTSSPLRALSVVGASNAYANFDATSYESFTIGSDINGFLIYSEDAAAYRFNIDSSGRVGIGETSMDALLVIKGDSNGTTNPSIRLKDGSDTREAIVSNQSGDLVLATMNSSDNVVDSALTIYTSQMIFKVDGSESMRIDSSGNLLVGKTASNEDNAGIELQPSGRLVVTKSPNILGVFNLLGNGELFRFLNTGTLVGGIVVGSSSTSYNTSSDYRLKENVATMEDATTRLKQLQPKRFNYISDESNTVVDGFLAHEVSSIVPEAITGEKDAIKVWQEGEKLPEGVSVGDNKLDENGNTIPDFQSIDQSKLVPLLVKTIQELEARITTLENA